MRAQLADGRPVAGKTGTTENYGDAWFVGYTPQLAAAIWVGYPNKLKPMTTEFNGEAVAGGTFPALIFKTFMQEALAYLTDEPGVVPDAGVPLAGDRERRPPQRGAGSATTASARGRSRSSSSAAKARQGWPTAGRTRSRCRTCSADRSTTRPCSSRTGRCAPSAIYKPAQPGQRVGVVIGQIPSIGSHLEPFDTVRLVLAKPLHGVVPSVGGPDLDRSPREAGRARAQGPGHRHARRRDGLGPRDLAGAARRRRGRARDDGQARSGRLRYRDPARA